MGEVERQMGVPISPLCDKEKDTNMAQSQIGFINYICLPFYAAVADLIDPVMKPFLQLKMNLAMWEERRAQQDAPPTDAATPLPASPAPSTSAPAASVSINMEKNDPTADVTSSELEEMAA